MLDHRRTARMAQVDGGSLGAHCWYIVIIERRVVAGRRVLAGKMGKRQEADGLGERGVTAEALQG